MTDKIPDDLLAKAAEIASKANECCYRSDGYEEDIRDAIAQALMEEREAQRERVVKICWSGSPMFWRAT